MVQMGAAKRDEATKSRIVTGRTSFLFFSACFVTTITLWIQISLLSFRHASTPRDGTTTATIAAAPAVLRSASANKSPEKKSSTRKGSASDDNGTTIATPVAAPPVLRSAAADESHETKTSTRNGSANYDIVTLAHEDDLATLLDYGLESWQEYFVPDDEARIFVICTIGACQKLKDVASQPNNVSRKPWKSLVLVPEGLFPFNLETIGKHMWGNKFTWIFQQMLKMYSYKVLSKFDPPVQRRYLVIDSDTVAVRPTQQFFLYKDKPVYNIASISSGAYTNDCILGRFLSPEVFSDRSIPESFPSHNGQEFTPIAHQMVVDGEILNEMMDAISDAHNTHAWMVLRNLTSSVLSEWEVSGSGHVMLSVVVCITIVDTVPV